VVAHLDPDGAQPDAARTSGRRGLTLTPLDGMLLLRGQLDPEAGAALTTALDALTPPPMQGEPRTPAQRRADALADLARTALRDGRLPTIGGTRPQIALLLPAPAPRPHTHQAPAQTPPPHPRPAPAQAAPPTTLGREPAWLEWIGDIPDPVAHRIACDADVWPAIINPTTAQPLTVGRAHRLVPHWIRKALHIRDRGCRFPGCHAPPAWTDAHHLHTWADGGRTDLHNLLLLCRYHHCLVHEGGWSLHYNTHTNTVTANRPNGNPYEIRGRPYTMDGAA
jgi:Domain of unknown function (DUF222)